MNTDAIIFDFDDTLVYTNILFDQARKKLFSIMEQLELLATDHWDRYLNQADIANVKRYGYFSENCFPEAMVDTYRHFAVLSGRKIDISIEKTVSQIGYNVLLQPPQVIEGALETLSSLAGRVRLFLITQGDKECQYRRLLQSGLLDYFLDYSIVRYKDTDSYRGLINKHYICAANSYMVGNSIRSDINPALAAGLQAIYYQGDFWSYELVEATGCYQTIDRLTDLLEFID